MPISLCIDTLFLLAINQYWTGLKCVSFILNPIAQEFFIGQGYVPKMNLIIPKVYKRLRDTISIRIFLHFQMEQRALKIVNNSLNTNIYS